MSLSPGAELGFVIILRTEESALLLSNIAKSEIWALTSEKNHDRISHIEI
jgi:hypothetical protein